MTHLHPAKAAQALNGYNDQGKNCTFSWWTFHAGSRQDLPLYRLPVPPDCLI